MAGFSNTSAISTIDTEVRGLQVLRESLAGPLCGGFSDAVEIIMRARGRVVVTGMGKSGHVARKITATLTSTGTPAYFLHPAEAGHGDLGMITQHDVIVAFSWSGETVELRPVIDYARRFRLPLVAITSCASSALGRAATVLLAIPPVEEACPHRLAPTTSTTVQMVLGDSLAVALLERRGFTAEQFKTYHPGGKLGAMLVRVADVMHCGDGLPVVGPQTSIGDALISMSQGRLGCVIAIGDDGRLVGILTDGDVRRSASRSGLSGTVGDLMNRVPITIAPDSLASEAVGLMSQRQITVLVVASEDLPLGIVHLHDLLGLGVA